MARLYATYKDGDQTRFVPLAVTLDENGLGVLKVDTEISVDGASFNIDNLFVASTDQTAGNAKYIKVDANGVVDVNVVANGGLGIAKHYNGDANIASATVTFAGTTASVQVECMDDTNNIYVSFDSGVNWRTVRPGETVDIDAAMASLDIKADVDTTPYEILTVE